MYVYSYAFLLNLYVDFLIIRKEQKKPDWTRPDWIVSRPKTFENNEENKNARSIERIAKHQTNPKNFARTLKHIRKQQTKTSRGVKN